jgi:hypothetical protein
MSEAISGISLFKNSPGFRFAYPGTSCARAPVLRYAAEFIALHLTSPRCSLQLMDTLPGVQMNFPPRARQRVQTFAADQVHQCGLAPT